MFAIIDLETTGLNASKERITEVAIYIHDGEKPVDRFETLVDPEKRIPHPVISLTGIDNNTVAGAPRFPEIARKIVEMTEGMIIVGHNVAFDYSFLRCEFKRLFYEYKRKTLCTRKLSRKLMPGLHSYGLGNLCKYLNISNESRHRAGGDALATMHLFEHLQKLEKDLGRVSLKGCNSALSADLIDSLPERTGVYYFLNKEKDIIYIGKSTRIRSRVLSHLNNNATRRAQDMKDQVRDIHYELTGSELIALLKESHEIKKYRPVFNRSQRRTSFPVGLFDSPDDGGYLRLSARRIKPGDNPLTTYTSMKEAREHINFLVERYSLCQSLCGIYKTSGACFRRQIHICKGACVGEEKAKDYNVRVEEAIKKYLYDAHSFYVLDRGRRKDERAVVEIHSGSYRGYGYMDVHVMNHAGALMDCIHPYPDNRDVQVIIKGYLRKHSGEVTVIREE
ncbi:MAG: exonuclease domain-containing protein [Bacteroidales bacterium]